MAKKMSMGKFKKLVKAAVRTSHVSRVRILDNTLTADTLLEESILGVDDDPDYDLRSDGTNVAEAQALSELLDIKLTISYFSGTTNAAGARVTWMLYKSPDGVLNASDPETLFVADITTTTQALRKNVVAFGSFLSSANNDTKTFNIRIKKAAMRRIKQLRDGDSLRFTIISAATGAKYLMYGTITWGI